MQDNIYKKLFEVKKAGIKLQRDTKAFNYKYATLSQIQEKLSWELEKQGLLVVHSIQDNKVRTSITSIEDEIQLYSEIPLTEWTKPQDKWSEITYYRRYNLLSLLDLEVEDDDWAKAQWVKQIQSNTTTTQKPTQDLWKCPNCGADNKLSRSWKPYCGATCWKN